MKFLIRTADQALGPPILPTIKYAFDKYEFLKPRLSPIDNDYFEQRGYRYSIEIESIEELMALLKEVNSMWGMIITIEEGVHCITIYDQYLDYGEYREEGDCI